MNFMRQSVNMGAGGWAQQLRRSSNNSSRRSSYQSTRNPRLEGKGEEEDFVILMISDFGHIFPMGRLFAVAPYNDIPPSIGQRSWYGK